jgi:hypothetical protein
MHEMPRVATAAHDAAFAPAAAALIFQVKGFAQHSMKYEMSFVRRCRSKASEKWSRAISHHYSYTCK